MSNKNHCAWCGPDKSHLPISHGICPDCAARMEAEARKTVTRTVRRAKNATVPACQRGMR